MTDYPAQGSAWRRKQTQTKLANLAGIFITVILLLALANGFLRSFSLGKYLGKSEWDGKSSLVIAANWHPGSILIFQPEPKRLVLAKFGQDLHFATGNPQNPVQDLASLFGAGDGGRMIQVLSSIGRTSIKNYLLFKEAVPADRENLERFFKKFASLATPLSILSGSWEGDIKNTNLTRKDLISLWWQVKSLGVGDLSLVDLGVSEKLVVRDNRQVLGVDSVSLQRAIGQYLENRRLVEERTAVSVQNASGVAGAGGLAADFVTSVGGSVKRVETVAGPVTKSQIVTSDTSYTALYLAKIFECGIKTVPRADLPAGEAGGEIKVIVGADFAQKYLF